MFELSFIILVGIIFWCGYKVGVMYTAWMLKDIIRAGAEKELGMIIDENYNIIETSGTDNQIVIHTLIIEKIKDTLYLYDQQDEFVCQAMTLNELAVLAKQYKNITYAAVLYEESAYFFIDGVVERAKNES